MALYKELHELKTELQKLELEEPHSWIGNLSKRLKIKTIKNKICKIEDKLQRKKCRK